MEEREWSGRRKDTKGFTLSVDEDAGRPFNRDGSVGPWMQAVIPAALQPRRAESRYLLIQYDGRMDEGWLRTFDTED